jgi:hypothetical protein
MDRDFNLLVVEAKARASSSARDVRKIEALTEITGRFGYSLGAYLHVKNRPSWVLQTGKIELSIAWQGEDEAFKLERKVPSNLLAELRQLQRMR